MENKFVPPFTIIRMPKGKGGQGPEMNPALVESVDWEIWDAAMQTVSTHGSEDEAWKALYKLNDEARGDV